MAKGMAVKKLLPLLLENGLKKGCFLLLLYAGNCYIDSAGAPLEEFKGSNWPLDFWKRLKCTNRFRDIRYTLSHFCEISDNLTPRFDSKWSPCYSLTLDSSLSILENLSILSSYLPIVTLIRVLMFFFAVIYFEQNEYWLNIVHNA